MLAHGQLRLLRTVQVGFGSALQSPGWLAATAAATAATICVDGVLIPLELTG
jgi:hypothetical protein